MAVKFTLLWKISPDAVAYESEYTFDVPRNRRPIERAKCIKAGLKRGEIFLGEKLGPQIRVPLPYSGLEYIEHRRIESKSSKGLMVVGEVVVYNPITNKPELWVRNDEAAGRVLIVNSKSFEMVREMADHEVQPNYITRLARYQADRERLRAKAQQSFLVVSDDRSLAQVLEDAGPAPVRIVVEPDDELSQKMRRLKTGPSELVENRVGVMPTGWKRGMRPSIPVPELPAQPPQSTEVLKRGDDGQWHTTHAYHNQFAVAGEIIETEATEAQMHQLCMVLGTAIAARFTESETLPKVRANMPVGLRYDFDKMTRMVGEVLQGHDATDEADFDRANEALARLQAEQNGDVLPPDLGRLVHLVKTEDDGPMVGFVLAFDQPQPDFKAERAICGETDLSAGFVAYGRYKQIGPPVRTYICLGCQARHDDWMAQQEKSAEMLGLKWPEQAAEVEERERIQKAREQRGEWAARRMKFESRGRNFAAYHSENGFMLALMDTGRVEESFELPSHVASEAGRPDERQAEKTHKVSIKYLLLGPRTDEIDLIFEGDNLLWPTTPQADAPNYEVAVAALDLILDPSFWPDPSLRKRRFWDSDEASTVALWKGILEIEAARESEG